MHISVIIPTLNAGIYIEKLLSALNTQDTRPSEVIIIDSSSEDNTVEVSERAGARVIVIPRNAFDHGRTRNLAARESKGDILVFMTQDALPLDRMLLTNLTSVFSDQRIAAAFARHIPGPAASPPEVFARRFNYPDNMTIKGKDDIAAYGIKAFFFSNVCSAVRRDLFTAAGRFPEGVRLNEDMLLAARLILDGYKVAYVPAAMVIHSHNYNLLQQLIRYYSIGSSLRQNRWLLKYARPEGEGLRYIREQIRFLLKERRYAWLPYIFLEILAKYIGYRAGLIAG